MNRPARRIDLKDSARRASSPDFDSRTGQRLARLPDYIEPDIRILFVGINPGLRSALLGHHFAGYSNRFWKVLYASGLVSQPLTYRDDWRLPSFGYGLTNVISRPTAGVHELTTGEYERGRVRLLTTIRHYRPSVVALLGLSLANTFLGPTGDGTRRTAGPQQERLADSSVFLLPNPSGRNAHYSFADMVQSFRELRAFLPDTLSIPFHPSPK